MIFWGFKHAMNGKIARQKTFQRAILYLKVGNYFASFG